MKFSFNRYQIAFISKKELHAMTRTTSTSPKASAETAKPVVKTAAGATKVAKKAAPISQTKAKKQPQTSMKAKATAAKATKTAKPSVKAKPKAAAKVKSTIKTPSFMPKGYSSVTPSLVVRNAASAIAFYIDVFGAEEVSRTYALDGLTILNAAVKIGDSIIHISDEMPLYGIVSPASIGGTASALQVYVDDVDGVWERAIAGLSIVLLPLEDAYWGERTGKLIDPFGHVWTLSKKVEDISALEVEARFKTLFGGAVNVVAQEVEAISVAQDADEGVKVVDISEAIATDITYAANAMEAPVTIQ